MISKKRPFLKIMKILFSEQNSCYYNNEWNEKLICTHITHVAKRGGPVFLTFSDFFFLKNRFLSDYVVAGCLKYIFGNFKNFLRNSEKIFFKLFTLGTFNRPLKIIPHFKKSVLQEAEKAKNRPWPKKSILLKSEISIPQSNHGKNIKLMLVRP